MGNPLTSQSTFRPRVPLFWLRNGTTYRIQRILEVGMLGSSRILTENTCSALPNELPPYWDVGQHFET